MQLNPLGRNWGPLVNWDDLGKTYAGFIVAWTAILAIGMLWLIANRRLSLIRIRNLPLILTSTCFLHVYLVKICLAYTTNGNFLCSAEFWIMSIYLPFGIALFQANVMQLRSVSKQQSRLLEQQWLKKGLEDYKPKWSVSRKWSNLTEARKGYIIIALGMLVQLGVTCGLFFTSPVLRGDWSSFGDVPYSKGQALCRKSYEWIPSAFWQLFFTWFWGPFILFQIRDVRDTHHWRLQTILTVVSGLPGVPLWLAALFTTSDAFKPINKWWVPPMWLAPGIIVMQFVTVFFPIFEFFEERRAILELTPSLKSVSSGNEKSLSTVSDLSSDDECERHATKKLFQDLAASGSAEGRSMYRIAALERALVINPNPLLNFAATRDFSLENIIFLLNVRKFKSMWQEAPRTDDNKITLFGKIELLKTAVDIFNESVCERTAEFPINIEDSISKALREVLGPYQLQLSRTSTPQSDRSHNPARMTTETELIKGPDGTVEWVSPDPRDPAAYDLEKPDPWCPESAISVQVVAIPPPQRDRSRPAVNRVKAVDGWKETMTEEWIPRTFDEHLFDAAEASVTVLVLTNTWRKFVREQQAKFLEEV